jgi:hypothetical protein
MSNATMERETDSYLGDAPVEVETDRGANHLERALAKLGWIVASHGEYLHEDGSTILCRVGYRKGTDVPVRYFTLTYGSGRSGGVSLDLPALVETHRVNRR